MTLTLQFFSSMANNVTTETDVNRQLALTASRLESTASELTSAVSRMESTNRESSSLLQLLESQISRLKLKNSADTEHLP